MRYFILPFLLFCCFTSQAQYCNYVLKEGTPAISVFDTDSVAELVYEIGSVVANQPFELPQQWILMPDRVEEKQILVSVDYEISQDTMLRITSAIPLEQLQCIEEMDIEKRNALMLGINERMYQLFSVDNNIHDSSDSSTKVIFLKDYSPETRSFFYHSFFFAESYIGKDILWDTENLIVWSQYLYNVSNNIWGAKAEGQHSLAFLFAGRPALFCEAYKLLNRTTNQKFIQQAVATYLSALLYTPRMQNGQSDLKEQFTRYKDRQADDRAALILNYYMPFLKELGLTEQEISGVNKNKLQ